MVVLSGYADSCANSVINRTDAPDATYSAVIFQHDCGATTGFSTQISVVERGQQPSGTGNAYRADDDHGAAAAGTWGGPLAEAEWLAPDHLPIRYARKSRVFEQKRQVAGVKISYEQVTR
jgi:hypothetical protein